MERQIKFRKYSEFPNYQISSNGKVWSLNYKNTGVKNEIKQHLDKYGYLYVFFFVNGIRYKRLVHRLVALTFIANPKQKPQVNHKNGVRSDNRIENLEWVTSSENCIHSFKFNGRKHTKKQIDEARVRFSGVNNPKSKITKSIADEIKALRSSGVYLKDIASKYKISLSHVSAISKGQYWNNTL